MCKLLGHIVKLIASMSTSARRHHHTDDSASRRRYRDSAPGPPSMITPRRPPSRETVRSSAIARPESSSSSTRSASVYPVSQVRNDNAVTGSVSVSDSQTSRDAHERVEIDRDGSQPRKKSTTSLVKDEESMYTKESGGTLKTKDETRPPGQYQDEWDDRRARTPRGVQQPPLKENSEIHRPPLVHARDLQPLIPPSASSQHQFEAQSRELRILQHEHRALLEEKKALTDAYAALRQHFDERSKKLNAARHELQVAVEQRKEIDGAYTVLRQQYDDQTKRLSALRHERQAALDQRQEAEENYATLWQKYEEQRAENNSLNNKYHSLKVTLEQRTSELHGVQKFLTTADTFSGSEVVNTLRKLNEEVLQSTTFMAEWIVENFTFETQRMDETTMQTIEQTRSLETLGTSFMELLETKKHNENPVLMEMACRAYLIYELYWVASPWSIGEEEQSHNMYIDAIYQRIQEAEGQAVSGNWRALTRAHTLPACISDPEVAHTVDTTIVTGLSDILLAAGCTASKSDITSAFWSKFGEKIHHFVSLAGQVNKMIGMGVISEVFEVLVIWPDTAFDERAMDDAYDNGDRNPGTQRHEETVLCATELGLMQRMVVGAGTGQRHKGKASQLIVIKPRVALTSVIDMIE